MIDDELPPQMLHHLREPEAPPDSEPFATNYTEDTPLVIDLGAANTRVGLAGHTKPNNVFPTLVAKHRDRKTGSTLTLVGNDILREAPYILTLKASARLPYDGPHVTNWDYVESILDYLLEHLGATLSNGCLNNPVVVTEPVACTNSHRRNMCELVFEAYRAPKMAAGIDSLFAAYANKVRTGIVVGLGHETTHVIPIQSGRGVLADTKRLDWGGGSSAGYLQRLLALKYPYFPLRLSRDHTTHLVHDHARVLCDYMADLGRCMDLPVLEQDDVVVQAPVEITERSKKLDEEVARQAERRREQGRRLQEQAQRKRLEKLVRQEQELAVYTTLRDEVATMNKADAERRVQADDFDTVADLHRYIDTLEKALRKARTHDVGTEEVDPATAWPLADVPDAELNEDQVREKRRQRLLRASHEARMRAKEEKEREAAAAAQYAADQAAWRERDLQEWCGAKRVELAAHIAQFRQRAKQMEAMKDRKLMAAQRRMKSIADLASDGAAGKRRRKGNVTIDNDPNDTFGADDADWNAYRSISTATIEEEQDETAAAIARLEAELLEHDPDFHHEDTLAAAETFDWRNLVLHKFVHGPRPSLTVAMQAAGHDPDELLNHPEIIRRNHQLHLNVERMRVPEVYFQPHMAGLDQAGVPELVLNVVFRYCDGNFGPGGQLHAMLENVLVTGGPSLVPGFTERLVADLTAVLPTGFPLNVVRAADPVLDAWRGMLLWALSPEASYVTRTEYEEMGPEYIKEHGLGNVCLRDL